MRQNPAKGLTDIRPDMCRAPEEIVRRLQEGGLFITEVMTRGKVLYEAGDA
jgi:hypothetical protein